jgi:membrane-associated protein
MMTPSPRGDIRARVSEGNYDDVVVVESTNVDASRTRGWGKPLRAAAVVAGAFALTALVMPENALAAKAVAVAKVATSESFLNKILGFVMHLDKHLAELFATQGKMAYGILFAIIFAETGFVVTPFLPGDSLLFATGALGALGVVNFPLTCALLFTAAVLGDTVNYSIGSYVGKSFMETHPKLFPPDYIAKTRNFYDKYGGKTVVLARFFVIVRTFAPFVAGVANMNYAKFITYNVLGAAIWIASFMGIGFFFGAMPAVQENFALAVAGIIVLSLVPVFVEIAQHMRGSGQDAASTSKSS